MIAGVVARGLGGRLSLGKSRIWAFGLRRPIFPQYILLGSTFMYRQSPNGRCLRWLETFNCLMNRFCITPCRNSLDEMRPV